MTKKIPWEVKYKRIIKQYPEVSDLNWSRVMREESDIFARLLGDVLKSEGRGSKPGKRPQLDRSEALNRLAKLSGEDFSEYDFATTFRNLTAGRSIRNIAHKTGLGTSYVHRLLSGNADPSFETMEKIAEAFRKNPSYFLEYRIAIILVVLDGMFTDSPETATAWYLKLKGMRDKS
jgi:transcriptional regulator with XRE-family HTH domain